MNIGIFGGSFDPPHIVHTFSCLYILETTDVEQIWVIPCYKHPFQKYRTDYHHRIEMCKIAMQPLCDKVLISDIESQREDISYTIDTVKILLEQYPEHSFSLILGTDVIMETDKWKNFDGIAHLVRILELPRPIKGALKPADAFLMPDISSTIILEHLKVGQDVSQYLSKGVLSYIKNNNLYSEQKL